MIKTEETLKALLLYMFFFILSFTMFNCSEENGYSYSVPETINDGWETASLASVGMDDGSIVDLIQTINNGTIPEIHGIIIIKNGLLVFEEYWAGHEYSAWGENHHGLLLSYDRDRRHNTHSATKSFTSALVGIAIDHGLIGSIDDPIFDYLPNNQAQINESNVNITIEDCLKMASGLEWNEWDVGVNNSQYDLEIFNNSTTPLSFLLSKPVITEPGTSFYYNGATVDLLGYIVTAASGQSLEDFSSQFLFSPLGITNYNWSYIRAMTCAHGDIYITPRDMAKFGYLYLNNGQCNGEQIISAEWIENSTQNHIDPGVYWADGYGYLWWLRDFQVNGNSYHSFKAIGWGGQEIFVFKELNMVVVFTGANYTTDSPCDEMVRDYILPALQ